MVLFIIIFIPLQLSSQIFLDHPNRIDDPCGFPDTTSLRYKIAKELNWGYGYSNLLKDIDVWKKSSYVTVEEIGKSVQNRAIYMLTITASGKQESRKRIWIHARTHPSEVEGTYVTNGIIDYLLSNNTFAKTLRDSCIFNIVPMINPDGVELKKARENANGIDIESNWNTFPHQPEVNILKTVFTKLMQSTTQISVALNMHSAYNCKRYFVYHASGGSSVSYTLLEQKFISLVQSHYPGGFENYDYFVSWVNGTSLQYPESWFWINYREAVLALTYEDMNCDQHGNYDRTAYALLAGITDFLNIRVDTDGVDNKLPEEDFVLYQNYPNPYISSTTVSFKNSKENRITLKIFDALGREITTLVELYLSPGSYQFKYQPSNTTSGGIYLFQLNIGGQVKTRSMVQLPLRRGGELIQ